VTEGFDGWGPTRLGEATEFDAPSSTQGRGGSPMTEAQIREFWELHPCGDGQARQAGSSFADDYEAFFRTYDALRYRKEPHILAALERMAWSGKQVLEIGLGLGADSEQIIRRGAQWSGLDLTEASVSRVRKRLESRNLPYGNLKQGSALEIPFPADSFDTVFSHGVLHHIPDILTAQREIARVLRPGGELIVMLYAKWSLNYLIAIGVLRRVGLVVLSSLGVKPGGIYGAHLRLMRDMGPVEYLKMRNFLHANTDGPDNPYSRVYSLADVRRDFSCFRVTRAYKRHLHAPPLPVGGLPLDGMLGWHLWVHMRRSDDEANPPDESPGTAASAAE
jgi:SAM-dependent methyltransferase